MSVGSLRLSDSKLRNASFLICLLVIASTPFERLGPIVSLPGQNLTNLELTLALSIVVWGLGALAARRKVWRTPLAAPWIALLTIMSISTLVASDHRLNALHFLGRCLAGFLFFLQVSDLASSTRRVVVMVSVALGAGGIAALLGILEYLGVSRVLDLLSAFQAAPGYAVGQTRVSSTFQYSTIASMYLEIVFALGVGLSLLTLGRKQKTPQALVLFSLVAIGSCVILTLTRGGLLALALTLALAGVFSYRRWGFGKRVVTLAILAAALTLVSMATVFLSQEALLRLTTFDQTNWYKAEYQVPAQLYLRSGELRRVEITLRNAGLADWSPSGPTPFRLAYHWLSVDGSKVADWEGIRTGLPSTLRAGREVEIGAIVRAPLTPGDYQLAWDVLQEDRFWFSEERSPSAITQVEVRGEVLDDTGHELKPLPAGRFLVGRKRLLQLALRVFLDHPWLGVGPDNFRLVYGRYAGLETFDLTYHTHNMFVEFFVNTGLIGGLTFLYIVWLLIRRTISNLKHANGAALLLSLGVSAAFALILAHGLLDYFLEFTPTYLAIFMVFALTDAISKLEGDAGADTWSRRRGGGASQ